MSADETARGDRLTLAQLLSETGRIFSVSPGVFVIPAALSAFVFVTACYMFVAAAPFPEGMSLRELWSQIHPLVKLGGIAGILLSYSMFARALAISVIVTWQVKSGTPITLREAYASVERRMLRLMWTALLVSLIARPFGWIWPFLLFGLLLLPAMPVAVIERIGVLEAIQKSRAFSDGAWLRLMALLGLFAGALLVVLIGAGLAAVQLNALGIPILWRYPVVLIVFCLILLINEFSIVTLTLHYRERLAAR